MNVFLGLPLWLWVLAGGGVLAAAAYFIRDWVRQVRARKAIDNVISSVAYDELSSPGFVTEPTFLLGLSYGNPAQWKLRPGFSLDVQNSALARRRSTCVRVLPDLWRIRSQHLCCEPPPPYAMSR